LNSTEFPCLGFKRCLWCQFRSRMNNSSTYKFLSVCVSVCYAISHGCPTLFGEGPQLLLWAGLQAACVKFMFSGIINCLNYCVIYILYT